MPYNITAIKILGAHKFLQYSLRLMHCVQQLSFFTTVSQLYNIYQVETIPAVLEMANVVCAAETGCGKTLAYVLPIIQKLLMYKSTIDQTALGVTSPLAIILTPSRKLAEQVAVFYFFSLSLFYYFIIYCRHIIMSLAYLLCLNNMTTHCFLGTDGYQCLC